MPSFGSRLMHAWNAFVGRNYTPNSGGSGYFSGRPDRTVTNFRGGDKSIITSIYNKISVDCAAVTIEHIRVDENGKYLSTMDSGLNKCLNISANIDQSGRDFIQNIVMTMLETGHAAIIPVDTTLNPMEGSYDIKSLRVGVVTEWYADAVRVNLYNERSGNKEDIVLPKKIVAIVQNPFYPIMNEPNSIGQRLLHKLNMLDAVDEQASSGKLDLIIQLPYVIKSEARRAQAEARRKEIEDQLAGSKYGIAYTDGTEKITQLNRSLENNLMKQIEYLTSMLYSQLGMPSEVFDGTADEKTMLNYQTRTIGAILTVITAEMDRKFITQTARTQGQKLRFFNDPFKLVPVNQIADIADKFTRNEILSSNEVRQIIGYKAVANEQADELRNKNLNQSKDDAPPAVVETENPFEK